MIIYLLLSTIILLIALLDSYCIYLKKYKISFISRFEISLENVVQFTIFSLMLLLVMLRDINIGTDYKNYIRLLNQMSWVDWKDLITYSQISGLEIGFAFCSKIVLSLSDKVSFVFGFWYCILFLLLNRFINQFSTKFFFSLYIFLTLSMYNQSFNILRQYIALAVFLFAFEYLVNGKTLKYILLVLLAGSIHISVLITLIFIVIRKFSNKMTKFTSLTFIFISFILSMVGKPLINMVVSMTSYSTYLHREVASEVGVGLLINILIFTLLLFFYDSMCAKDTNNKYFLFASAMSLSLNLFISDLAMIGRLMIFFKIFYIISVVRIIENFKINRALFETCIYLLFFIYYSYSVSGTCFETSPYIFMS